jgi:ABC-type multidrug transport system ATPase subunit
MIVLTMISSLLIRARRFMWKVIARMSTQDAHCSVILTTHSMEEAEALCTRIGISKCLLTWRGFIHYHV